MATKYDWSSLGPNEGAVAAATLSHEILSQIPALAPYSLPARRDAAIAEILASLEATETGVGPPNPLNLYGLTSANLIVDTVTVAKLTVARPLDLNPGVTLGGGATAGDVLTARYKSADTTTFHQAIVGYGELTAASTFTVTGTNGYAVASNATGAVANLIGVSGQAELAGAGAVTSASGGRFTLLSSGAGAITEASCIKLINPPAPTGTYTTLYGLLVQDITRGSTNYAIYTGAGTVRFGDVVQSAAGQESTDSGAAALGANCPAVTPTAPYTWIKMKTSDGSTVYYPVWK